MAPRLRCPALGRNKETRPTPKALAVLNPDRSVSKRMAKRKQRGDLKGDERASAIITANRCAPGTAQFRQLCVERQFADFAGVLFAQYRQRTDDRMLGIGLPWQPDTSDQQGTYRSRRGVDQSLADKGCAAGRLVFLVCFHQCRQCRSQIVLRRMQCVA